jgi:hypothetical protein
MALLFGTAPIDSSFAQGGNNDINPWADCGIGAAIFENDTGAIISNVIWDLGTTAVTSMLVSPETCEGAAVNTALFIRQTYPQLAVETAKGNGKHLTAVTELMGCEQSVHDSFVQRVRADMASNVAKPEFASLSETEKAEQYFNVVYDLALGDFSTQCGAA